MKNFCILILLLNFAAVATAKTVNLYIWSDYVPNSVIQQFEHQSGITVNVTEYDNNETLYAKIKAAPHAGYDIIVPSSYYVDRMRQEGMLHHLNKNKIPNIKYLNKILLNKKFDPHNNYSLPYLWGTTGIVVNKKYLNPKNIKSWRDFWQPQYKNQLLILDDMQEAFAMALLTLGYPINDTNPLHIKEAYLKLKKLMPNIKLFNADAEQNIYIDEDAIIGMGWSGDIHSAQQENPNLEYIYPKEGFNIWIDCLAIAKNAPHLKNAYKLINFLLKPKIAKEISLYTGYSSPNTAAMKLLPAKMRHSPVVNPDNSTLKRGQFARNPAKATEIYAKYWELLKIGG